MSKKGTKAGGGFLAVFFCIPLAFIVYFWISYSSQSISLGNVQRITVEAPDTQTVIESAEDLDFFVNMITRSLSINTAMRDVSGESPVKIVCDREDKSIEYLLYPSTNLSGCLLVGPEGKLSVLETETAKVLLLRDEFTYLYAPQFLPKLEVVSGESRTEILPTSCEWNYKKTDGNNYAYTPSSFSDGNLTVTVLKGLENKLLFTPDGESRPYEMTDVSYVASNGSEYSITDISELSLSNDTLLTVSFKAVWKGDTGSQAFGSATYKFNVLYDVPALIEITDTELKIGDVIEVRASHLNSDEKIELSTLLKTVPLDFEMTDENTGVAFLPVGLSNVAGDYSLEFKTAVSTVNHTVTVKPRTSGDWTPFEVSEEQFDNMLSTAKLTAFREALAAVTESRPDGAYSYKLKSPAGSTKPKFVYGQQVNFGTTGATGDSGEQVCTGVTYVLKKGTAVKASQAGVVVFAGELAPTGNTVILYHGYGIYTYYFHLDSIAVELGSEVKLAAKLGTVGQTGFTNGKYVLHFAVSIDGEFVDPVLMMD